jgi:hypothetical protein
MLRVMREQLQHAHSTMALAAALAAATIRPRWLSLVFQ